MSYVLIVLHYYSTLLLQDVTVRSRDFSCEWIAFQLRGPTYVQNMCDMHGISELVKVASHGNCTCFHFAPSPDIELKISMGRCLYMGTDRGDSILREVLSPGGEATFVAKT